MEPSDVKRLVELAKQFGYWNGPWLDWWTYCRPEAEEYGSLMHALMRWQNGQDGVGLAADGVRSGTPPLVVSDGEGGA